MHFNSESRFHRFVSSCVIALLTANGFAIALLATDNPLSQAEQDGRTLTLITTADGQRILADPNTEAGRQAIEEAKRNGSTLTNVPVPTTSSTAFASQNPENSPLTLPPSGVLPIDPGSTLNQTINYLLNTATTVSSIVEDTKGSVVSIVEDTKTTVDSVVEDTKTTVDSIIDDTQSTIANVSTSIAPVITTVSTTLDTVSTTVGGIVTTVVTTVGGVLNDVGSTTSGSTGDATDPICTLLVC